MLPLMWHDKNYDNRFCAVTFQFVYYIENIWNSTQQNQSDNLMLTASDHNNRD